MFQQRRTRNMFEATAATLALIYHQTVYNIRSEYRNPVIGLVLTIIQASLFVVVFLIMFTLIGIKQSPIRGDFLLYIMSGIFIFMVHTQAVGAVSASHSISSGIMKHEPLNAAILIAGASLASLYKQVIAFGVILGAYYVGIQPFTISQPVKAAAMVLVAWGLGCIVGLVFVGIRPWSPQATKILSTAYMRVNMFASGKFFVANAMPGFLMPWFDWNPLFHLIDQTRGFLFVNYTPMRTDPMYPIWFGVVAFMIGLLINFTTRKYESVSWGATQ